MDLVDPRNTVCAPGALKAGLGQSPARRPGLEPASQLTSRLAQSTHAPASARFPGRKVWRTSSTGGPQRERGICEEATVRGDKPQRATLVLQEEVAAGRAGGALGTHWGPGRRAGLTSVCTRSWLERPSLSWSSLRSEFLSFFSSVSPSLGSATPSDRPRRSPFRRPTDWALALPRGAAWVMAALGTTILTASTSTALSSRASPSRRTPGLSAAFLLGLRRAGGRVSGAPAGTSMEWAGSSVSIPSPAPRTGAEARVTENGTTTRKRLTERQYQERPGQPRPTFRITGTQKNEKIQSKINCQNHRVPQKVNNVLQAHASFMQVVSLSAEKAGDLESGHSVLTLLPRVTLGKEFNPPQISVSSPVKWTH